MNHDDPRKAVIAVSPNMRRLMQLVERVATTDVNVLISGESGTGKDLIAATVHRLSKRAKGPFVKIDCSSLPASLVESELFGYEKGAFTDARESKPGRLELAHNGTLVLDDISQLGLSAQGKILRVIEEKRFQRLGGLEDVQINTRIIALTNVDLEEAVSSRTFRHDLFYRINVIIMLLPALRERKKDIIPLAKFLLKRLSRKHRKKIRSFSAESLQILSSYDYPGNVRELQNVIERAVILAKNEDIPPELLPSHLRNAFYFSGKGKLTLAELEKRYINEILEYTNGHKSEAARILGIHRKTLLEKRKLYGIK